jgi:DNA-binding response OmpR family regulator
MKEEGVHILYVEDDVNLGFVTKDNLKLAGYSVLHCSTGQEALEAVQKETFSICILDIMLPQVDGFEIATAIRAKDKNVPIIFLSAKSLSEDKIKGLKIGADDYITKPFSIEELLLKIKIFLRRSQSNEISLAKSESEKIGSYLFDPSNFQLNRNGKIKKLTGKEAELLLHLCANKNQVLRREDILQKVWGDDDYFLGRSLDVFISRLRSYFKDDKSIKIENIHGVGFRMNC